ncbi:MAG: imidazolonepropionase, partial [Gemmatimonadales bacterium]
MTPPELLHADLVVTGASELVTPDPATPGSVQRIDGGVVAVGGGMILAVGTPAEVATVVDTSQAVKVDAAGGIVLPGFVDCHTHLLFGGSRAREYAAGLTRNPEAIKALGIPTGIAATVGMTRAASDEQLLLGAVD